LIQSTLHRLGLVWFSRKPEVAGTYTSDGWNCLPFSLVRLWKDGLKDGMRLVCQPVIRLSL